MVTEDPKFQTLPSNKKEDYRTKSEDVEVGRDYKTLKLVAEIDSKIEQLSYILAPILRDTDKQSNDVTSVSTRLGRELEIAAYKLTSLLNRIELWK